MRREKSPFVAIVRPDLVWFMLGDIVGDASGIFDQPDDPEGAQQLHGIYMSTRQAISTVIKSGDLAIRAWPLWNTVSAAYMGEYDEIDAANFGIAISDLHEWLQTTGYPVAKTPAALYEVFKRRWAAIVDEPPPDSVTVTPSEGAAFDLVGVADGPTRGRPANGSKQQAYDYYRDRQRQIEIARDMQKSGMDINPDSMIAELIRLSGKRFPGSDTSSTTWARPKNFTITIIYKALGIKQVRNSKRMKKPVNPERSKIENLFRN
ncbi:hypothetical protein ACSDBR_10190 [Acidithiobacillus ferriphilus]|uniref:hypothetical protein n=1 Tax=Acidithiobacillus ferriphilus TaxID=1689834 RepID=UPI003F512E47